MMRTCLMAVISMGLIGWAADESPGAPKAGAPVTKEPAAPAAPAVEKTAGGLIKAKDNKGREWKLEDWKEGTAKFPAPEDPAKYREWAKDATRPYPKDLKAREEWYLKKNGENWDGPVFSNRILTPGDWKWEVYACYYLSKVSENDLKRQ